MRLQSWKDYWTSGGKTARIPTERSSSVDSTDLEDQRAALEDSNLHLRLPLETSDPTSPDSGNPSPTTPTKNIATILQQNADESKV